MWPWKWNAPNEIYFANIIIFVDFILAKMCKTKILVLIIQSKSFVYVYYDNIGKILYVARTIYYKYVNILEWQRLIVYILHILVRCLSKLNQRFYGLQIVYNFKMTVKFLVYLYFLSLQCLPVPTMHTVLICMPI
jgi:hypothetical protein